MNDQPNNISRYYVRLGVKEKIGFGFGDMASNLSFGAVSLFLLYFYTNFYGLTATQGGAIILSGRIVEAIFTIIIGYVADRTHTRWGKLRPFILMGALPLAVLTIACFIVWPGQYKFYWALLSYSLYCIVYTSVNSPYSALINTLTQHAGSRASLSSYRVLFAALGYLCVSLSIERLVSLFTDEKLGYVIVIGFFAVLATLLFLLCFAWTTERVQTEQSQSLTVKQTLAVIISNKPLCYLSALSFFVFIAYLAWLTSGVYYVNYVMQRTDFTATFFFIQTCGQIAGPIICSRLLARIGKKRLLATILLFAAIIMSLQYFIPANETILILFCVGAFGFSLSSAFVCMYAMVADTVEYSEYYSHSRSEGSIFGFYNFICRLGMGIGGGLSGVILASAGYNAEFITPTAISAINMMLTVMPALMFFFAFLFTLCYQLDEETYLKLVRDIELRKHQQAQ